MSTSSLRQRKKDRTRNVLIEVSGRLFAKQGYDATTLEQICAEAEVSVPTLLVYFESKERLALARDYDALAEFRAQVQDPTRELDTLTLWRGRVKEGAKAVGAKPRSYLRYNHFLASSPVLARGLLALLQQYEDLLAEGMARDYGTDPHSDLATRLLATTLSFGNQTAVRHWVAEGGKGDLTEACLAVIDFVIENLPKPGGRIARGSRPSLRRAVRSS